MNLLFWGITFGFLGKLLLGIAVLRVHLAVLRERGVDGVVFRAIRNEEVLSIIAILLVIIGYFLEIYFYSSLNLFSCEKFDCAALLIGNIF